MVQYVVPFVTVVDTPLPLGHVVTASAVASKHNRAASVAACCTRNAILVRDALVMCLCTMHEIAAPLPHEPARCGGTFGEPSELVEIFFSSWALE